MKWENRPQFRSSLYWYRKFAWLPVYLREDEATIWLESYYSLEYMQGNSRFPALREHCETNGYETQCPERYGPKEGPINFLQFYNAWYKEQLDRELARAQKQLEILNGGGDGKAER